MGHALWKTGDPAQGMTYYNKALALNPMHKGALEYQGELFVELGQLDKAKENLAKLNHLCWLRLRGGERSQGSHRACAATAKLTAGSGGRFRLR